VVPQIKHVAELLEKNAELAAKLQLSEQQLDKQQQQIERLKSLEPENRHLHERVMLLEEEVRWFKEQVFGRSSHKSTAEICAEQKLLFNEAEVLAAIEAADAAHAARTTPIAAHERKAHSGGRERIPEHLPRKEIVHDLPNEQKHCEHPGVCWAMECIGEGVRSGAVLTATRACASLRALRISCPRATPAPRSWPT
jgi:transposase